MADITTRTGKGAALTHSELDDNFTNLNTDKAELSGADFTGNISVDGNISVTGTVDGRDVATDGTKLDGIEASADVTDTTNVVASLTAGTNITIAADGTISASGTQLTNEEVQDIVGAMLTGNTETGITVTYQDADGTIDFVVDTQTDENFTTALKNKLDAIEAGATADQTAAEIRALVESATDSNVFTDADHTKLDGIETGADVTDTANVTAAGALMDSEVTNLADVKSFDPADYATAAQGTTADSALQNVSEDTTPQLGGNLDVNGQSIVSTANGDINITPNGTGNVSLGNLTFDADQTVGAGQDNYVLTYDNTSGNISLEAATGGGGGLSDVVDDTTPQLGGNLDLNSNNITGTGNINTTGDITVSGTAQSDDLNVGSTQQFTVTNIGKVTTSSYVDASSYRVGATSVIDSSRNIQNVGNITLTGTVDGRDVAADGTKLDGIAAGAEVNAVDSVNTQTGAVVLDADDISDSATTNKFTTAGDITKLAGIETGADVTDTANVTAAGAVMDSELTSEASVKALNQGVATTDSPSFAGLTVDTNTLKVDSTNNRVGILNATPDVTLDVGSATDAVHVPVGTTAQRPSTPAAGYLRYNSTTGEFEGFTTAWGGLGSGSAQSDIFVDTMTGDGSTTTLTLTNGAATENNTQVYIDGVYQSKSNYSLSGTTITFSTAPPNLSDVEVITIEPTTINEPADGSVTSAKLSGDLTTPGTLSVSGSLTVDNTAGSPNQVLATFQADMGTNDRNFQIKSPTTDSVSDSFRFVTSNAFAFDIDAVERLTIDSNGRVGISNDTPDAPLDITGASSHLKLTNSAAEAATNTNYNISMASYYAEEQFSLYNTDTYRNMSWIGFDNYGQEITFGTGAAGSGAQRMVITKDGYVGIGGVPSGVLLDVMGTTDPSIRVRSTGTGTSDDTLIRSLIGGTTASNYIYFGDSDDANAGQIRYVHSDDSMRMYAGATTERLRLYSTSTIFYNGGTEIGRFHSNNNFGIGTPSPSNALHIKNSNPTIRLEDSDGAGVGIAQVQNTASGNLRLIADPNNDAASSTIEFEVDGTEHMRVTSDGNVGIGTNNPDKALVVSGAGAEVVINDTDTTDTPKLRFRESGTTSGSISTDASALKFDTGTTTRMTIDSSGQVGIGGTASGKKFEVIEDSGNAEMRLRVTDGTSDQSFFFYGNHTGPTQNLYFGDSSNTAAAGIRYLHSNDSMLFTGKGDGTTMATFNSSGHLGLGTSNPPL